MSLRYLFNAGSFLIVPVFAFGVSIGHANAAAGDSSVQVYTNQALPVAPPPALVYEGAPLAAGTLTLDDVLKAHPRPTEPQAPSFPAASALMMSQGMRAVLQNVEASASIKAEAPATVPVVAKAQTQLQPEKAPVSLVPSTTADSSSGFVYQPGQAPKNLENPVAGTSPAAVSGTTSAPNAKNTSASSDTSCSQNVQKWEKTCAEAGYPATFVGKISGETRVGCSDGTLHDVWVANTCAPPDAVLGPVVKANGVCGISADKEFDKAPTLDLCGQGIPSALSGTGPWTWVCAGVNGGDEALCAAKKRVPDSNGACGAANGSTMATAPASGLCSAGKASEVKGNGPWTWVCEGTGKGEADDCSASVAPNSVASKPKTEAEVQLSDEATLSALVASSAPAEPERAAVKEEPAAVPVVPLPKEDELPAPGELCGTAAETMAYEAPENDLCRSGTASSVSGNGPWTWNCTSNEGVVSSCRTLSLKGETEAAPEASAPAPSETTHFLKPSEPPATTTKNPPKHAPALSLACGTASGQSLRAKPKANLCQGGKASAVHGSNPWTWTCSKGKNKVLCATVKPVDGSCGTANGTPASAAPSKDLCASGTASSVSGNGPWAWTCEGLEGGNMSSCSAPRALGSELTPPKADTSPADAAPVPTPSKSFDTAPAPSPVPGTASVKGDAAPSIPELSQESTPVQPPAVGSTLPSAPVLKESETMHAAHAAGSPLTLDPDVSTIMFAHGSGTLDDTFHDALDKLVALLQKNTNARISLIAYADGSGVTPRAARRLSLTRALAIRDYLSSKGISESRVDVHAEGVNVPSGLADRVDVKVNG
jgi:outer membrane protein OmpA-like peptidoglycan-associated protein